MKRFPFIYFILFVLIVAGCNTGKKMVRNTYAFTSIRMPGTIPVDEQGRRLYKGPDTTTLVFVETASDEIIWETAWKDGKSFRLKPVMISQTPLELGIVKETGEKIMLSADQENHLWQLQLIPDDQKPYPENLKSGEIQLSGKYRNKIFNKKITGIRELAGPDAQ